MSDKKDEETEKRKKEDFLNIFQSVEELRDWIFTYLDIDLPIGHVDPDSNSSPSEWMYEAYSVIRDNRGNEVPGIIALSARSCYKTVTASILEVLAIVHFKLTISHMASIKPQSAKAIQYINGFFRKIKPYMKHHNLEFKAENKANIQVEDGNGDIAYIVVIVCTMTGANCIGFYNKIRTNKGIMSAIDAYNYKGNLEFLSLNHTNGFLEYKEIEEKFLQEKELVEVETEDGVLEVSPDHEFFVENKGYVKSVDLEEDDIVYLVEEDLDA